MNISAQPMYQLNPCIKACMAAELAGSVQVLQSEKPQSLIYQWMHRYHFEHVQLCYGERTLFIG